MRPCAAAVIALALGIAGCGDDDRLSRDEYVEQADAICAKYEERLEALPEPENVEDLQRLVDEGLPIAREGINELKELKPPEELEAEVDRWHERNEANLDTIEELGEAAEQGDEQRIQTLAAEADENEQEADRLARDIGLDDCAQEE